METAEIYNLIAYVANGHYEEAPPIRLERNAGSGPEFVINTSLFMLVEELRKMVSWEYFLHVFNVAPDMFFILNRDGRIMKANSAVSDKLGYQGKDIAGLHLQFSELIDTDRLLFQGHSATARFRNQYGDLIITRLMVSDLPSGFGHYDETLVIAREIRSVKATAAPSIQNPEGQNRIVLSDTDRSILEMLAQGKTSGKIGKVLGYSRRTIEFHRRAMMNRLGAENAANLIDIGYQLGLLKVRGSNLR